MDIENTLVSSLCKHDGNVQGAPSKSSMRPSWINTDMRRGHEARMLSAHTPQPNQGSVRAKEGPQPWLTFSRAMPVNQRHCCLQTTGWQRVARSLSAVFPSRSDRESSHELPPVKIEASDPFVRAAAVRHRKHAGPDLPRPYGSNFVERRTHAASHRRRVTTTGSRP